MSIFNGLAKPRYQRFGRIHVSIELLLGYVMIRDPNGAWLGAWPAVNVSAMKLNDWLVRLSLGDEEIELECAESVRLIEELEVESAYFRSLSGWRRIARRARASFRNLEKLRDTLETHPVNSAGGSPPYRDQSPRYLSKAREVTAQSADEDSFSAKFFSVQDDVIRSIAGAMISWFAFYFMLGEGTPRERLLRASRGFGAAAESLRLAGGILEDLTSADSDTNAWLRMYQVVVAGWADSFEKVSAGARLDQRSLAREGFARMDEASAIAETLVQRSNIGQHPSLRLELATLREFQPRTRVSRRAVDKAKAPWRRALRAAGALPDWTISSA